MSPKIFKPLRLFAFARGLLPVVAGVSSSCATMGATVPTAQASSPAESRDTLDVYALPIGQGDAILVVAPDGAAMLVDGGGAPDGATDDPGARVVAPFLRKLGIQRLGMMVMTHPHPDHIRGLLAIADEWPIEMLVHGGTEPENPDVQKLLPRALKSGAHIQTVSDTPENFLWHGLQLSFLHPRSPTGLPYEDQCLNDNSVVLQITYRDRTVLLTADIETFAENLLTPKLSQVEVLKVAHHGGSSSSTSGFLAATRPQHAIISCGQNNPYGVPRADVLQRLSATGARVWRTDTQGLVHFSTDGTRWAVQTEF